MMSCDTEPYHDEPMLVVVSGGQDSLTCLHWARARSCDVHAVSFDYGQRHAVELECATRACKALDVPHEVIKLPINQLAPLTALTNLSITPGATHDARGLPNTFVPGRNLMMLTAAASYAGARGFLTLVTGVCQTDHVGYPDCRQETISVLADAIALGLGHPRGAFRIDTPLMHLTKAETFELADELGALDDIIEHSHTCYQGDRSKRHAWGYGCAACSACQLRAQGWADFNAKTTRRRR